MNVLLVWVLLWGVVNPDGSFHEWNAGVFDSAEECANNGELIVVPNPQIQPPPIDTYRCELAQTQLDDHGDAQQ